MAVSVHYEAPQVLQNTRTVRVTTVNALTLEQWIEEFQRLKKLNQRISRMGKAGRKAAGPRKDP